MTPLSGDWALLSKLESATPLGGLPVEFVSRQQQRLIEEGFVEMRSGRLFLLAAGREWLREVERDTAARAALAKARGWTP